MSDKHYVHPHDENDLEKVLKQTGTWFETYGTTAIYGLAAAVAVIAAVIFVQRRPPATAPVSAALMTASTPEAFRDIADQYPDSELGIRARLRQADLLLKSAFGNLFTNRKVGLEELESAQKAYERLDQRTDLNDDTRERVLVGLARVAEYQCDGGDEKVKAVVTAWERVRDFPGTLLFDKYAEERIKAVSGESARALYAWFQQQDPKPGDEPLVPQDGPSTVPAVPDAFQLPDLSKLGLEGSASDPATPAEPAAPGPSQPETSAEPTAPVAEPTESVPAENSAAPEPAASEPAAPAAQTPEPAETSAPAESQGKPAE